RPLRGERAGQDEAPLRCGVGRQGNQVDVIDVESELRRIVRKDDPTTMEAGEEGAAKRDADAGESVVAALTRSDRKRQSCLRRSVSAGSRRLDLRLSPGSDPVHGRG